MAIPYGGISEFYTKMRNSTYDTVIKVNSYLVRNIDWLNRTDGLDASPCLPLEL